MKKGIILHARVGDERLPPRLRRRFRVLELRLSSSRSSGDFNTDGRALRSLLGKGWNAPAFDLLNIMCAIRAADRYFTSAGLFRARRTIRIAIGVTNVRRWLDLRTSLSNAVTKLSRDTLRLYPIRLPEVPEIAFPPPTRALRGSDPRQRPDCVCLLSGGADSFAGAAYLLARGRHPIFVSQSVGPVSGLQKRLHDELTKRFPQLSSRSLIQVRTHPNHARIDRESPRSQLRWKHRDNLQRLRSMFFFSLAGIVAQSTNINEIFMCENGLVAAAIAFAPIDDTPYNTRPAEPHFLRAMQEFLRLAFNRPHLEIRNPFQYMTKGQVVSLAAKMGLREHLYRTVSCWRSGNCGLRNCGQCVPCLFRQLAFEEAGLPGPSFNLRYRFPIPRANWRHWNSEHAPLLEDIRQYCVKALRGGIPWLLGNELAVTDAVDVTGGPVERRASQNTRLRDDQASRKVARVILRFARAALKRLK